MPPIRELRHQITNYLDNPNTKSTNFEMFASDTRGEYGGMGTPPVTLVQFPLPPFFIFSINVWRASLLPLYRIETSFHAGPTTFFQHYDTLNNHFS